jgi:aminoglycoside phosphotransferase (APT) family kinase protein
VPQRLAEFAVSVLKELPDGDRLCHGDFHPGNIIRTDGEPVLIDWTNVTRGDPNADLARTNLMLRVGEPPPGSSALLRALAQFGARFGRSILLSAYLRAYRRARTPDAALVKQWQVPVAANRVVENIEGERAALLSILEARLEANG